MKTGSKYRLGIIIIAALFIAGAALALILFMTKEKGNVVQVRIDGEIAYEFSLSENTEYTIEGIDGGTNHLVIENGRAYVDEASCPDGLCINMGKIDSVGQSIVCLPNRVVVEIVSKDASDETEVDIYTE